MFVLFPLFIPDCSQLCFACILMSYPRKRVSSLDDKITSWIPACAGMTDFLQLRHSLKQKRGEQHNKVSQERSEPNLVKERRMKKYFRFAAVTLLTVSLCGAAFAKLPPELLDKLNRAKALKEAKIKDMVTVETREDNLSRKPGETITIYTKRNKSRQEIRTAEDKEAPVIVISDGTDMWQLIDKDTKIKTPYKDSLAEMTKKYQEAIDNNYDNLNFIRSEKFGGKDCYVVDAAIKETGGKNAKCLMWLDKKSALMYQKIIYDGSGAEQVKTVMSDYRDIFENIKMPFLTKVYVKDKLANKVFIRSVKVNQRLRDSLFDAAKYYELPAEQTAGQK